MSWVSAYAKHSAPINKIATLRILVWFEECIHRLNYHIRKQPPG